MYEGGVIGDGNTYGSRFLLEPHSQLSWSVSIKRSLLILSLGFSTVSEIDPFSVFFSAFREEIRIRPSALVDVLKVRAVLKGNRSRMEIRGLSIVRVVVSG